MARFLNNKAAVWSTYQTKSWHKYSNLGDDKTAASGSDRLPEHRVSSSPRRPERLTKQPDRSPQCLGWSAHSILSSLSDLSNAPTITALLPTGSWERMLGMAYSHVAVVTSSQSLNFHLVDSTSLSTCVRDWTPYHPYNLLTALSFTI